MSKKIVPAGSIDKEPVQDPNNLLNKQIVCLGTLNHFCCLISCFSKMPLSGSLDMCSCGIISKLRFFTCTAKNIVEFHVFFFTNYSGIPYYFIMEFHIKNKLWKSEIKYYCPFIMNFHSCS